MPAGLTTALTERVWATSQRRLAELAAEADRIAPFRGAEAGELRTATL